MNMERSGVAIWTPAGRISTQSGAHRRRLDFRPSEQGHRNRRTRALEQHRYHEAAQTLWDFVWHEFCDWYLEVKKLRFREGSGLDAHWRCRAHGL